MKQIIKDFRNWWGPDGDGIPVWFVLLTIPIGIILGYYLAKLILILII